jgi:hypothetical protein
MDSLCVRTLKRMVIGIPFAMGGKDSLDPKSVKPEMGSALSAWRLTADLEVNAPVCITETAL